MRNAQSTGRKQWFSINVFMVENDMPNDNEYFRSGHWWFPSSKTTAVKKSIFPHPRFLGGWEQDVVPWDKPGGCIQGWKLHVCVFPGQSKDLFSLTSSALLEEGVLHKYRDFDAYDKMKYGSTFFKSINRHSDAIGKALVVYPTDPFHLFKVSFMLEALFIRAVKGSSNKNRARLIRIL